MKQYFLLLWLILFTIHLIKSTSAAKWNWSFNEESCSSRLQNNAVLHIYADRNHNVFSVSCAFQNDSSNINDCDDFNAQVSFESMLVSNTTIKMSCLCSSNDTLVCYQSLKHSFIACALNNDRSSFCTTEEMCGGGRQGCRKAVSCAVRKTLCSEEEINCCCNSSFCNGWYKDVAAKRWKWKFVPTNGFSNTSSSTETVLYVQVIESEQIFEAHLFPISPGPGAPMCEERRFSVGIQQQHSKIHLICSCSSVDGYLCYSIAKNSSMVCAEGDANAKIPHAAYCLESDVCGGKRQGCVPASSCSKMLDHCIDESVENCCCNTSFCNGWFSHTSATPSPSSPNSTYHSTLLIIVSISIGLITLFALTMFLIYRKRKHDRLVASRHIQPPIRRDNNSIPLLSEQHEDDEAFKELVPPMKYGKISKMKILSRGQRGTRSVFVVDCDGTMMAAKYFSLNDYSSWDAELKIYSLPRMKHENLLQFIGYTTGDVTGDGMPDYAIYTELLPLGSLQDVLKERILEWDEMLHISAGMMCGLAYLHSAIPSSDPKNAKPPIAHRDFKSRNVLLKEDLTACVADFGLALPFDSARRTSNCGQVGTLRYMAPEVLDLAVSFNCDAFLRIDVYACGLTLWELLCRCNKPPEHVASPVYIQPFEEHLNRIYPECQNHPSPNEMQDIVFNRRLRPTLPSLPSISQALYDLVTTIEQCWDHDSEARPSAGCVFNRIRRIRVQSTKSVSSDDDEQPSKTATTATLNNNKTLGPNENVSNSSQAVTSNSISPITGEDDDGYEATVVDPSNSSRDTAAVSSTHMFDIVA